MCVTVMSTRLYLSFSVQKPYDRYLRDLLAQAYDFFLDLERVVDEQVKAVLNENTPDWRLLHSCPCCRHEVSPISSTMRVADDTQVPEEEKLSPKTMIILDGNNSQKRSVFATEDRRLFDSDFYLPENKVNEYGRRIWVPATVPERVEVERRDRVGLEDGLEELGDDMDEDVCIHFSQRDHANSLVRVLILTEKLVLLSPTWWRKVRKESLRMPQRVPATGRLPSPMTRRAPLFAGIRLESSRLSAGMGSCLL
jgi:hypothetical protein